MNRHLWEEVPAEFEPALQRMDHAISRTLARLAIFPHSKGYTFIKDSILYLIIVFSKGENLGEKEEFRIRIN